MKQRSAIFRHGGGLIHLFAAFELKPIGLAGGGGGAINWRIAALAVPFWLMLIFSDGLGFLLLANFVLLGLSLMWLGPAAADVHDIAGPHLRGLGIGIYFFSVNIAAYMVGSNLIGKLNDWLGVSTNPQQMRYALLICPAACLLAALMLLRGSRSLNRETGPSVSKA